jgi:LruC domain-containing protein
MKKYLLFLLGAAFVAACNPFSLPDNGGNTASDLTIDDVKAPSNFNFNTSANLRIKILAKDASGTVLKNVPFSISHEDGTSKKIMFNGSTTEGGTYEETLTFATAIDSLTIETPYIGLPSYKKVAVKDAQAGVLTVTFGDENREGLRSDNTPIGLPKNNNFTYIDTYNRDGVPTNLVRPNDVVNQRILDIVNASLPEGRPVPQYNPEYLSNNYSSNIEITETADVWVTFVHEGAGYRNALGYYTYPTGNPPTSADQIQRKNIIFPNVSFRGSGGSLVTGNKVLLGRFNAGTTIAWFLVPDGWSGSNVVDRTNERLPLRYSDAALNTFTTSQYRRHVLLLNDRSLEKVLIGFEDLNRPDGDNDFNDAIFYVSASPYRAIRTDNLLPTRNTDDTDGDGVNDAVDIEPRDSTIAYESFSPAQGVYGTLAFEDLFPNKGDYDLNDLVIDYNFRELLNARNQVVKIEGSFKLRASGATVRNGFGIHFPGVLASKVASITGHNLEAGSFISLAANGSEAGQSKATMMLFDDALRLFAEPNYVNTDPAKPRKPEVTINTVIRFNTPITRAEIGTAPYNPFMIVGKLRGKEVHLPNYVPTDLMNRGFFGAGNDNSNPATGRYYKTTDNMPFGIHIIESFKYPIEKIPVNQGYNKFKEWVESNGERFPDWYKDRSGYRNNNKLY